VHAKKLFQLTNNHLFDEGKFHMIKEELHLRCLIKVLSNMFPRLTKANIYPGGPKLLKLNLKYSVVHSNFLIF
jgi:hypothetical protein